MKDVVSRITSEKVLKAFFSRTTRRVDSKTSHCNSSGEALHVGESSVALRRPVPEISEITNAQTDTHTEYGY